MGDESRNAVEHVINGLEPIKVCAHRSVGFGFDARHLRDAHGPASQAGGAGNLVYTLLPDRVPILLAKLLGRLTSAHAEPGISRLESQPGL